METTAVFRENINTLTTNELTLGDIPLFHYLSEDEMNLLETNVVLKRFKNRTNIYREGSRPAGVYVILSGIVKVYKIGSKGKHHILRFAKRGDVIAYRSVISNELACSSAKTYDDNVVVAYIPLRVFFDLIHHNQKFAMELLDKICKELHDSNCLVTDIAQKSLRELTAQILLLLKKEFGVDLHNSLQIKITRTDLANMIGTVTESLIRVMSGFRDEGLLDLSGKRIIFLDTSRLQRIASFR
ncbi:cAMP-binding domain of CRP or a regulatory subunit of cAMP-dependent protein kinases [Mariniphaga anaerophila]|uniref:cAMP-binding domain of CRP or a regulatory subunit of cAMP-dependent protein kinases n=1 Tax=Mariniphaga anaerophila TaxID=1484053 RepID=A0A1M5FMB8_9BACT|nr:Crp/Fnr family transcriptional regulator [Mariniphaga anaerophila]SHF92564.1 cAMP-binding domain of CRP or a regulatory subunit of cAMP-dependent protein kinases [Mariniphaga anaerophila]